MYFPIFRGVGGWRCKHNSEREAAPVCPFTAIHPPLTIFRSFYWVINAESQIMIFILWRTGLTLFSWMNSKVLSNCQYHASQSEWRPKIPLSNEFPRKPFLNRYQSTGYGSVWICCILILRCTETMLLFKRRFWVILCAVLSGEMLMRAASLLFCLFLNSNWESSTLQDHNEHCI